MTRHVQRLDRQAPKPAATTATAAAFLLAALCLALAAAGCGRAKQRGAESFANLKITRYRYNIDEVHKTARVMAEIANPGTNPVSNVPITAILRGPDGSARGENTVTVDYVKPGESQLFSVNITTHGRERDVDFQIGTPPPPAAAPGNSAPEGSARHK